MKWLTTNTKLKKDGIFCFNLPPISTCPCAGECKSYCYALQSAKRWPSVRKGLAKRFLLSTTRNFVDQIVPECEGKRYIRIHSSGDFYSEEYVRQWRMIALSNPNVQFYAYTKSVSLIKKHPHYWPKNLRIIFSYGGLQDNLIDPSKDRHCKIFATKAELDAAGYVDVSESDLIAATTTSLKLGIVKH